MSGTRMQLFKRGGTSEEWVDQEVIVDDVYLSTRPGLFINLDTPYELGVNQLEVYFNGQRLSAGGGYEEVNDFTIRLDLGEDPLGIPYALQVGDEIFIRNWVGKNRVVMPDNPKRVIVFVIPDAVSTGVPQIELFFPFRGRVLSVKTSLSNPGETATRLKVQKASQNDLLQGINDWVDIAELTIQGEKKVYVTEDILDYKVNINDFFRVYILEAGRMASGMIVEVVIEVL